MVAFGGAGPIHAAQLAKELRIPRVVVPPFPGVASAMGLLVSDLKRDYIQSHFAAIEDASVDEVQSHFEAMEAAAGKELEADGIPVGQIRCDRALDLRYSVQKYELTVPVADGALEDSHKSRWRELFDARHEQEYGTRASDQSVEIVNYRLTARVLLPKPSAREHPRSGEDPRGALKGSRRAYFEEWLECPLYERERLNHKRRVEMPYGDLREFISALDGSHELRRVEEAHWDLEIGAIAELNYERRGPALLFDRIPGYPKGYRILTNAVETLRRSLLSIDLPLDLGMNAALEAYEKKIASYRPVPPQVVPTGPVFENVLEGAGIDLEKFPTPRWHEDDGGRYIGTGCVVLMRDPDNGGVNFGTYRVMVHDKNTAGLYITPNHTGAIILRKYWEKGRSCPVAVSLGQEPVMFLASAPYLGEKRGVSKYDLAGYFRAAPVEVVREEVTGLPIPATAEAVLAGEVAPPEVEARPEGPFGEWTGYYASGTRLEPVIRIKRLYHRNDPILLGMPPVKFRGATAHFGIPVESNYIKEKLQKAGIEDVLDVWNLAVPGVTVVQIRQRYPGHAMKAALAASGVYMGRFVVLVDEDINPRDPEDVLWAMGTRCDPESTITILKSCQSSALDPRIAPERKLKKDFTSSRAIIDACKPYDWIKEFPRTNVASRELRNTVLEKWQDLFPRGRKQPAN